MVRGTSGVSGLAGRFVMMRCCILLLLAMPLGIGAQAQPKEVGWKPLVAELLQKERPGYGGLCGLVVDHANGNLYINLSDKGIYRSVDQGKSFQRMSARP